MSDLTLAPEDLETVKKILGEHVGEHEVRAFGSRVSGRPRRASDLDLVVMTQRPLPLERLLRLRDAFRSSDLPFRVDVLDWSALDVRFREEIAKTSAVVQQSSPAGPRTGR